MFQSHSPRNLLNATQEQGNLVKYKILEAKTVVSETVIYKKGKLPFYGQSLNCILPDHHVILVRLPAKMCTLTNFGENSDEDERSKM